MEKTSIEANKAYFDWIDKDEREKGVYKEVYSKIIDGKKVEITEITKIGRDFVVINFERNYNPAIPYKCVPIA